MPETIKTQTPTPEAGSETATHQDLQRVALRELVTLSRDTAVAEAQNERRYQSDLQASEKDFEQTGRDIESRYEELKADIESRYAGFIEKIEAQYQADIETLTTAGSSAEQKVQHESATIEREIKQKFNQAAWLAESVLEATQNQVAAQARASQEAFSAQNQLLDSMDQRGESLAGVYRAVWPAPVTTGEPEAEGSESQPPPEEGLEEGAADYDSTFVEVQRQLALLGELRLPRLFVGALPFVLMLLICGGAGLVSQLVTGMSQPQWKPILLTVGATLVVLIAVGAVLRVMARNQVDETIAALRSSIDTARRLARREHELAARTRARRNAHALHQRDVEIQAARNRYDPVVARTAQGKEATLKSLEEERGRLIPKIEAQRLRGRTETDEWHTKAVTDLEQGHEREVNAARERRERRIAEIEQRRSTWRGELEKCWTEGLARIQAPIGDTTHADGRLFPPWNDPAWQTWTPPTRFARVIRMGEMRVDLKQITDQVPQQLELPATFSVPALLAFPRQASLLIHTDLAGRAAAMRTLQTVMVRLLTSLPAGRVRFTIIDPVGLGQNFAGFMHLADYDEALIGSRIWTDQDHIEARLSDLTEHMETVIQKYLRNEFESIDDYNAQAGELAEPYRFLVIADLPVNFTDIAIRRLNSIASTGARCGVYTLVARDVRQSLPSGVQLEELEAHSVNLVQSSGRLVWKDPVFQRFPLTLDDPPSEEFLTRILHVVGRAAKESRRVEVPFGNIAPTPERMWKDSTSEDLEVPIGRMGATRLQTLRLGRGVAQHVLIAGKTGSGKSTLLHVLITNLAMWYSPDEVEFYLVDFKKGVEFKAYATHALPHARAIAVESDREFGLSVLQRVDAELARRGALFRNAGVQDLAAYRQSTREKLPRTLLIIDEFQEFFSEDDRLAQDAGLLLDRLVRQGRAFGIHVLLGSQTIGGTSGLARSTMGQMAVRIALQTSEADSQIILGDGNSAARLLSRPGEAIYNDAGGLVEANSPFQVAWLPDDGREQYLDLVRGRTDGRAGRQEAVVFEGNVPADLAQNRQLAAVLNGNRAASASNAPRAWLGDPVAIKDPTAVVFRRQSGANLLIVGQQEEAAMGVLAAAVISLGAQHSPQAAHFQVFDGSPGDSLLARVLPGLKSVLPQDVQLVDYRAVPEAMAALGEELRRRQAAEDSTPPSLYVVIYGLQRYRALRRQEESFSFSASDEDKKPAPDRIFADLLREGPALGIHVLAWCDTPASVERTIDRTSMREFDNRILFQMSAADSSNLIDSPMANKLGQNRALSYSEEQGTLEKFRPYAVPESAWLQHVAQSLRTS